MGFALTIVVICLAAFFCWFLFVSALYLPAMFYNRINLKRTDEKMLENKHIVERAIFLEESPKLQAQIDEMLYTIDELKTSKHKLLSSIDDLEKQFEEKLKVAEKKKAFTKKTAAIKKNVAEQSIPEESQ